LQTLAGCHETPLNVLDLHPVDLPVLGDMEKANHAAWLARIAIAKDTPALLFEFWEDQAVLLPEGPMSKQVVTEWSECSYNSTCLMLNSTQVGGVVDRPWLIVARYKSDEHTEELQWPGTTDPVK
jgi:hypothetical protein